MYEKLATKFIAVDTMVSSSCEIVSKTLHDFDRQKWDISIKINLIEIFRHPNYFYLLLTQKQQILKIKHLIKVI